MLLIPTLISGVYHPLISALYTKKTVSSTGDVEQVLIAETNIDYDAAHAAAGDDEKMWDLLTDLPKIRRDVEKVSGPLSYLEIRYASGQAAA